MSASSMERGNKPFWARVPSWILLIAGIGVGLLVAVIAMDLLMAPGVDMLIHMVQDLTIYSALSVAVGFLVYRLGWRRSPSLIVTLSVTFAVAALLTLFNFWVMARLMFVTVEDFRMATVFLLFASTIAIFFGITVMSRVTGGMRNLAQSARRLAEGDLGVRAEVQGRDEVAQLAHSFNQMAEQLQAAEQKRVELEKLRRDLIAWTSHDLRTPLTSIRAMVEALNDGVVTDPEMTRRYYRTIRHDVIGLNNLIDDLFELAQLDAGGLPMEMAPHALSDLISDALERFRALAAERGVTLAGSIGEDVDPVRVNAGRIERVLNNLLINGLNHTPAGGTVSLTARRTSHEIQVIVRDTGPGFAAADLPRVFEKFYRGEEARSRAQGSAGLGLAIARGIVEAHGGRIWADNQPEGGAVIGFSLPG